MNIVDILIIGFILFGAAIGFKNGVTKQLVKFLGFIVSVIAAFSLKNTVSVWMYENLPFFGFGGIFAGISVLNIIAYEVIAFLTVFAILQLLLKVLTLITGIIEKVLDLTIILGIFSKILGACVGFIQYFVYVFIILYILSFPIFDADILKDSKYKDPILNKTPLLSGYIDDTIVVMDKFSALKDKYEVTGKSNEFNLEALNLFLEYKIITVENVDKLVSKDKLNIDNIESVLSKYREVK